MIQVVGVLSIGSKFAFIFRCITWEQGQYLWSVKQGRRRYGIFTHAFPGFNLAAVTGLK